MTGERSSTKAAWLGTWWGLGHTLTLFIAGAVLVVLPTEMPAGAAQVFELGAILLLVGFGLRAIYHGARPMPVGPTHTHRRPGPSSSFRVDRWTLARPFLSIAVGCVSTMLGLFWAYTIIEDRV